MKLKQSWKHNFPLTLSCVLSSDNIFVDLTVQINVWFTKFAWNVWERWGSSSWWDPEALWQLLWLLLAESVCYILILLDSTCEYIMGENSPQADIILTQKILWEQECHLNPSIAIFLSLRSKRVDMYMLVHPANIYWAPVISYVLRYKDELRHLNPFRVFRV